jgi:large-conductance mechanosensitive channel
MIIRAMNSLLKKEKEAEKPAALSKTEQLLTEIRDSLAPKKANGSKSK